MGLHYINESTLLSQNYVTLCQQNYVTIIELLLKLCNINRNHYITKIHYVMPMQLHYIRALAQ